MGIGANFTLRGKPFRKTVEATFYVSSLQYAWRGKPFFTNCFGSPIPGSGAAVLLKVDGAFKTVSSVRIKVDGMWKAITTGQLKRNNAWTSIDV